MRSPVGLFMLLFIALAACSSEPPRRPAPVPQRPAAPAPPPVTPSACMANLEALPMSFRRLSPRRTAEGCGFDDGVQLLDIGLPVAGLTAMSCPAATGLYAFVTHDVRPLAQKHFGERLVKIDSFGTYNCRSINSRPGARLSEHAYANAVDIAAFRLASGRTIRVEQGWRGDRDEQAFLRDVHAAACRRFVVVIGPDGDAAHYNHIHMDMGPRGPYCR